MPNHRKSKKKHTPSHQTSAASTGKEHYAVICRIFPQTRGTTSPPQLHFLLQKKAASNQYGFVSCQSRGKATPTSAKYALRDAFNAQCGRVTPNTSTQPETPPIVHAESIEYKNTLFWVFLLPSVFNSWVPSPDEKFTKLISYANEPLKLLNGTYNTVKGHVWVDASDLCSSCQPGAPIVPAVCEFIPAEFANIAKIVMSTAAKLYHRNLLCAQVDSKPVLIFQETAVQILLAVDYTNKTAELSLVNMSKSDPVDFVLQSLDCPTPAVLAITNMSFPAGAMQKVQKTGKVVLRCQFEVKNFFSFADLPVAEFMYQTVNSFHRIRFRLPMYVYRLGQAMPHHTATDGNQLQADLQAIWGSLGEELNVQVRMGPMSVQKKTSWLDELKKCAVPVCPVLPSLVVPVLFAMQNTGCLFLLNMVTTPGTEETVLHVQGKHSNIKAMEALMEVIYGLSSASAGLESSLLDIPPY